MHTHTHTHTHSVHPPPARTRTHTRMHTLTHTQKHVYKQYTTRHKHTNSKQTMSCMQHLVHTHTRMHAHTHAHTHTHVDTLYTLTQCHANVHIRIYKRNTLHKHTYNAPCIATIQNTHIHKPWANKSLKLLSRFGFVA